MPPEQRPQQPAWLDQVTAILDQLADRGTALSLTFESLDVQLEAQGRPPMHVRLDGRLSVQADNRRAE